MKERCYQFYMRYLQEISLELGYSSSFKSRRSIRKCNKCLLGATRNYQRVVDKCPYLLIVLSAKFSVAIQSY